MSTITTPPSGRSSSWCTCGPFGRWAAGWARRWSAGAVLAATAASKALVDQFRAKTRYFNTFASSPLQAAVGLAVIDYIDRDKFFILPNTAACYTADEAIRTARLLSNPGCYPTASLLGLLPLERAGLLLPDTDVVIDAKSGISGAGKAPSERTHFSEVHGSLSAYGVFGHRHGAEIEQGLGERVEGVEERRLVDVADAVERQRQGVA